MNYVVVVYRKTGRTTVMGTVAGRPFGGNRKRAENLAEAMRTAPDVLTAEVKPITPHEVPS